MDPVFIVRVRICIDHHHGFEPSVQYGRTNGVPLLLSVNNPVRHCVRQGIAEHLLRQGEIHPMFADIQPFLVHPPCDTHEAVPLLAGRIAPKG